MLFDQQWLWKENRALTRRPRSARLKERGVIEDIDYRLIHNAYRIELNGGSMRGSYQMKLDDFRLQ